MTKLNSVLSQTEHYHKQRIQRRRQHGKPILRIREPFKFMFVAIMMVTGVAQEK